MKSLTETEYIYHLTAEGEHYRHFTPHSGKLTGKVHSFRNHKAGIHPFYFQLKE